MKWLVIWGTEIEGRHATREEAREHAAWLRRHPSYRDSVIFGYAEAVRVVTASAWAEEQRAEAY